MIKSDKKYLTTGVILATALTVSTVSNMEKSNRIEELTETKTKLEIEIKKSEISNKTIKENMQSEIDELSNKLEEQKEVSEKLAEDNANLKKELSRLRKFELTYYTSLPIENGGHTITAIQTRLRNGVVASNYYTVGTKIEINGKIYTVEDRGGSEFNSPNRLDVLVERNYGESDSEYYERVNNMGRKQVIGKIL